MDITARLIRAEDKEVCQTLDCGDQAHERLVTEFLRDVYWRGPRPPTEQTILAFVVGTGELYGFGTWKHRNVKLAGADEPMKVIDIPYFGVHRLYQGAVDEQGRKLARRFYVTVEGVARSHEDSTADTPVHLVCDVRNTRGQRFWHGLGFEEIERLEFDNVTYTRMIRR